VLRKLKDITANLEHQLWEVGTDRSNAERVVELSAALEELKVAQEELLSARVEAETQQARYHDLFEFAPDGYLVSGPRGRIEEANVAASELLKVPPEYLLGKPMSIYIHPDDRVLLSLALGQLRTVERGEWNLRLTPRGSQARIVHVTARAVHRWGGELEAVRWSLRDVTEQNRADRALNLSREQVRSMASRLSLAEEQERRRIATEIHDHISQSLAVAKLRLGMMRESLAPGQVAAVDEVRDLLSQAIAQSRSLTFELSPTVLYELGLGAAIEWLIEQRANFGVRFEFKNETPDLHIPRDLAITLFQAVRELLINIVKHAQASNVVIRLSHPDHELVIDVEDNGIGFNATERLIRRPGDTSMGLFSVQERLDHLGGSAIIDSTLGQGTRVHLTAPLKTKRKTSPKRKKHHVERTHRG
jgi:PAS domain S-box-containing protein